MQYISRKNDDLKSGNSTFVLQERGNRIDFYAYTGDTATNANKQEMRLKAYKSGYFLRKGFSQAIESANPNVLEPIFIDLDHNKVHPSSIREAVNLIYKNELTISGFKFKENISKAQKAEAFGKLINSFVSASKNLDFSSTKNLFVVQSGFYEVAYNNGGSEKMQIDGVDVQEKLKLNTTEVALRKKQREIMLAGKRL